LMALCPNFNKSVNVSAVSVICFTSLDTACYFIYFVCCCGHHKI
jgi:hypothetical protein